MILNVLKKALVNLNVVRGANWNVQELAMMYKEVIYWYYFRLLPVDFNSVIKYF
jgi:hypothetical protein